MTEERENANVQAVDADILAIDFETTGTHKGNLNLPWQLGGIRIVQGKIVRKDAFSVYLNVPMTHQFNPYSPGRWANCREKLAMAPSLHQLWPAFSVWLSGRAILAHHAPTERSILNHAYPCHSFGPWLDTLEMARMAYPQMTSYKLEDIIPNLGLTAAVEELAPSLEPHDAFYDACASAVLFLHILSLDGWRQTTVSQLAKLLK